MISGTFLPIPISVYKLTFKLYTTIWILDSVMISVIIGFIKSVMPEYQLIEWFKGKMWWNQESKQRKLGKVGYNI